MLANFGDINFMGVAAATVANFVLGGIYFGVIIAKQYLVAMGRENEPKQKPSPLMMFGPVVCGLVMTIALAVLIKTLNVPSLGDALCLGALVAVGFQLPMTMTIAINPNFPRPFFYTAINAPYFLISSLVTCALLFSVG